MRGPSRGSPAALRIHAAAHWLAAFAAGSLLNLAFAPFGCWPLAMLGPAALFALIRGLPPRRAGATGAAFGLGFFFFGTYWIYTSLHVFGLVPLWLTLLLQLGLVGILSCYPALLCYLANRFWLTPTATRDWLVLPSLWLLAEWLRGWLLTGFPWLSLGYAFIDSPLAGWAPLFGVYGVTWAAAIIGSSLHVALVPNVGAARRAVGILVVLLAFVLPARLSRQWTHPQGPALPIAAVQGAVPQSQKWLAENRMATRLRYTRLTEQAWGAQLILWPEAALPELPFEIPDYLQELRAKGMAHKADFAIGMVDYQADTRQYRNGVLVMSTAGGGWYYKRHLVPFGEYFPVPRLVRSWMRLMSLPYDDFTAGDEGQRTLGAAGQKLGITICYEDAFGSAQLSVLREATLLVNFTNNAWFGDSTAPHQHLQIARMRALEAGRYLVFTANDGITAAIGPRGEVVARLPQFQQSVMRADVQPMTGLTPYARWGNYPVVAGSAALLALAVVRRRQARNIRRGGTLPALSLGCT